MADRVQWQGARRRDFQMFMQVELMRAITQRRELERTWRDWLELYRAPDTKATAHFPFEGASNRTFPLAAMNVDPIWARYMQNVHAPENLWTIAPLNERWVGAAKPLQDYLTWLDNMLLKMWNVNMGVFMEMLKLGTGIYKTHWLFERRNKFGYDASKRRTRLIETINQPIVDHVRLDNFLLPPEAREIDPDKQGGAQWVAERHRLRPLQLRAMSRGQEPFLPNFDPAAVEKVIHHFQTKQTDLDETKATLDRLGTTLPLAKEMPIEFWEVHVRFDTTGKGVEDDVVALFHPETMEILRSTYATTPSRPYTAVRYLRGDGFYGIGVCEQTQMWQNTISDVLNYNIDKILLSNAPMLAVKEGANVVPDEPIFPGKQWHLTEPSKDITPFFLTAPGSFDINTLIGFLQESAKQRTGVTDLQFGTVGTLPSRTPATTVQSLLQEGNTRFDMSIKDLRIALGEVGLKVLQNLQAQATDSVNNPDGSAYLNLANVILGEPEGQFAVQALTVPFESIELGVGVSLTATSGTNNKELMRQSNLALLQLMTQLGPGFIQLAQIAAQDPGGPVGQVALDLFQGGRELLGRTLEQFDIRNPEDILPNIQAAASAMAQATSGQAINPLFGAAGAQGFAGNGGLGGL